MKSEKLLKKLSVCVFILYLILLIWVVIFKCNIYSSLTNGYHYLKTLSVIERFKMYLVPFADYMSDISAIKFKDGILNIIVFIPFGLYLSYFIQKMKFLKVTVITILLCSLIEIFQLYSLIGSFQTEDLITNIVGAIFGYLLFKILFKKQNHPIKIKVYNIISIIVIIICIPIASYAIIRTIENFDIYIDLINRNI